MKKLVGAFWIGAALTYLSVTHVAATDHRYSVVFAKMEAEFEALKGVTDPVEIRRRHLEKIKATGNFSVDPCHNFLAYSCQRYYKDINDVSSEMQYKEFDFEVFKFQMKPVWMSDGAKLEGEAAQKLRAFFNSCLKFDGLQKTDGVFDKLFAIVDNAADWTDAAVTLLDYGIEVFFHFSHEGGVKIQAVSGPQVHMEDLRKFPTNFRTQSTDETAQNVFQFKEDLEAGERTKDPSSETTYGSENLGKKFPALQLQKFLRAYGISVNTTTITVQDQGYLENLNRLLLSAERSTIDLFLKVVVFDKVSEMLVNFTGSEPYDKCFGVAYKFFDPVFRKVYVDNFLSEEFKNSSSQILKEVSSTFGRLVAGDDRLKAIHFLELAAEKPLTYTDEFVNSLYSLFHPDPEKGFPDLYLDVIFSDNLQKKRCLSNSGIAQPGHFKLLSLSRFKNIELCKNDKFEDIPLNKLSVPYYNLAYPDFWNYASLGLTYYAYVPMPLFERLVEEEHYQLENAKTGESVWEVLSSSYNAKLQSYHHEKAELLGYEELNLTPMQAFFLALVQNSCHQVEGPLHTDFMNFERDPYFARLFECNVTEIFL